MNGDKNKMDYPPHFGIDQRNHAQSLLVSINDLESRLNQARQAYQILYGDTYPGKNYDNEYKNKNLKRKRAGSKQKLRDIIFWKGKYLKAEKDNKQNNKYIVFK
ncbi:uncharacterized protein LOC141537257 isoform X1 [Cotesia typhae]|uniref:uncharacterized protein LOC141537257 isoform X1 n=1 Tax=Cotesia typhae TaxID=2053667 RepID=UPI003D693CAA